MLEVARARGGAAKVRYLRDLRFTLRPLEAWPKAWDLYLSVIGPQMEEVDEHETTPHSRLMSGFRLLREVD